jgi:hypothetical protein
MGDLMSDPRPALEQRSWTRMRFGFPISLNSRVPPCLVILIFRQIYLLFLIGAGAGAYLARSFCRTGDATDDLTHS